MSKTISSSHANEATEAGISPDVQNYGLTHEKPVLSDNNTTPNGSDYNASWHSTYDTINRTAWEDQTFYRNKRICSMSLAISLVFPTKTYIAADSKCVSVPSDIMMGFGGHNPYSNPLSFQYKKIFRIKDTDIIGFSVGDNTFGEYQLIDFIKSIPFRNTSELNIVAQDICDAVNGFADINSVEFCLYQYIEGQCYAIKVAKRPILNCVTYPRECITKNDDVVLHKYGVQWAQNLADYMIMYKDFQDDDIIYRINKLYNDAASIGHYFDNSVGGITRIIKLEPGKEPQWIQGEYDLSC